MEHLNQLIGENLKRLRAEKALSLDAVAKLSGVSKSMLGQIERGEVNPTISTMWRIASGLKVSFTALVTRAEQLACSAGCSEFASDARIENAASHSMHRALGFSETERVVYFRKALGAR